MHDPPDAAFFGCLFGSDSVYAVHLAASHGDVPQIHKLLDDGEDIDVMHVADDKSDGFGTALNVAVWRNQSAAFVSRLDRGANMDILDAGSANIRVEDTPTRLVVRHGQNTMAFGLLNHRLPTVAASPFWIDSLSLLLQAGTYPNYQSENSGMTALQMALITRRDVRIFDEHGVKALLDCGAKIDVLDKAGKSKIELWRREIIDGSRGVGLA
ncbi:hypothetical protein P280DRAFT_523803 [Massarina eburnea CBS 473.64]|uniref:Peptidase A2 domain-containing protein n=1 Tax=Massarina eburnea CBS 473.64 TaxID=1395130 RepID=A0A6A6RL12_9PLEO|nr:hypothetical protein P280DRAFT_523803 [Massarina eburnea CBS 473.64]